MLTCLLDLFSCHARNMKNRSSAVETRCRRHPEQFTSQQKKTGQNRFQGCEGWLLVRRLWLESKSDFASSVSLWSYPMAGSSLLKHSLDLSIPSSESQNWRLSPLNDQKQKTR